MAHCIQLSRRNDPKGEPVKFQDIDEEICKHFQVKCDDTLWHHGWYNYICMLLASGFSWQRLRQILDEDCMLHPYGSPEWLWAAHMRDILDWLEASYTERCWREMGFAH